MTEMEKIAAAANRLAQLAKAARNSELRASLREIVGSIRGALAKFADKLDPNLKDKPR